MGPCKASTARVKEILCALYSDDWQSEANYQHQNFAERCYRDIERSVIVIMNASGADDDEWLLVLKYVIYVRNRTAHKSLGWKTPIKTLTGHTLDISVVHTMPHRARVCFS